MCTQDLLDRDGVLLLHLLSALEKTRLSGLENGGPQRVLCFYFCSKKKRKRKSYNRGGGEGLFIQRNESVADEIKKVNSFNISSTNQVHL